jgi:eukaryotic-like serine/threonine-protein kinase
MNATKEPQRLGRYALHDRIAAGGMATVYFGQLVGSGGFSRIVAVKRLHPHLAEEKEFASMLLDEAYLAGRIRHPNVVSTLDIVSADKELFVVMDYVHGETLARLMKAANAEGKPIPPAIAVAIIVGVLNGLHAAHETTNEQGEPLRIVHRDVSPQNVVVGVDGIPRLLDFGVAKAQYRLHTTQDGQIKGKLAYMAVEQLTNQGVDRRADIYGAGVILWELLAGRRLFAGETESSTMHIILSGNHPRPSTVAPGVTPELDTIAMRALARNPAQRYETARQMSLALEQALPVATTTAVGEWVATIAEPQLAERARIMRAIDAGHGPWGNAGTPSDSSSSVDVDLEESAFVRRRSSEDIAKASSSPSSPTLKRPWLHAVLWLVGAIVLALGSIQVLARTTADKKPSPEAAAASAFVAPIASSPAITDPPASALTAAETLASAPSARPSAPAPAPRPRPRPSPAARTTKPDCSPPYTVDETGVRHYKPECSQ